MCEKMMVTNLEFLVTKDEMLVALATIILITILSPGTAFKKMCLH